MGRLHLALGAAVVSAGTTGEALWEEHSCQKRAGVHLTSSELPTDLICSPGMPKHLVLDIKEHIVVFYQPVFTRFAGMLVCRKVWFC